MTGHHQVMAIFQSIGPWEMVIVGIIALLIFGRRLPEVGRSLGKSFVEFKKGLKDTGDELKKTLPSDTNIGLDQAKGRDPSGFDQAKGQDLENKDSKD